MGVKDILGVIETPYVDAQTLLSLLSDYRKPREYISRLVKNQKLIRIKNGFYLVAHKIKQGKNTLIPYEQVANLLYGPSYVSLEWALSFYGMIPERVHTVTCMTLGKNKNYRTPIGDFVYYKLSPNAYSIGVTQKKSPDFPGGFLIASPEKTLADLVFKTCKGLSKEEIRQELLESKRIDRECFHQFDRLLLGEIAKCYRAKSVDYLTDLIGVL